MKERVKQQAEVNGKTTYYTITELADEMALDRRVVAVWYKRDNGRLLAPVAQTATGRPLWSVTQVDEMRAVLQAEFGADK